MVRFANVLALSLVLVGLSTSASPVINEQRDIERRTTSLSCGWAKKDGVNMGCMCKMPGLNIGIDLGGLNILDLGLKQYPPGCKPTCDDKVYECPYGKNEHGGCNEPHPCPPNQCESYGKCCPYGTVNMHGTCCPQGCKVKEGQCYVPHPEPEPVPQCGENAEYSKHEKKCKCEDGYEMFDHKCVKECGKDMYRNKEGHCVCNNHEFKPDDKGVCRPQCYYPYVQSHDKKSCVCGPEYDTQYDGSCKKKFTPATCHYPYVQSHDKKSCVCGPEYDTARDGSCKKKAKDCGPGKKWCETKCCRQDQVEKNGQCGCPEGYKNVPILNFCKELSVLGINL